ncbi:hypothetical protein F4X86_01365 [Candidatus Saccharibacteria bacterium]|nr:hypothetical protein [Candidatus Saccharibacteria bacterium]
MRKKNKNLSALFAAAVIVGSVFLLVAAGGPSSAIHELGWSGLDSSLSVRQHDGQLKVTVSGLGSGLAAVYYSGPVERNNCHYGYIQSSGAYFEEAGGNTVDLTEGSGGKYYCFVSRVFNRVADYEPVLVKAPLREVPFERGRIIDDDVLVDYGSMSVSDIEHFLKATVGDGGRFGYGYCDRYGSGKEPAHTCLFEYQYNPATGRDNYGLFDKDDRPLSIIGGLGAAEIIHQAAQDFEINPQVLLTTLQKEQTLVTDPHPERSQFRGAAGFACPDGRGCSASAKNFYDQVRGAAWALRKYIYYQDNGFHRFSYKVGVHRIPTYPAHRPECPSMRVNIENKATAALYIYTPYVYASKDIREETDGWCTSNGNKNFWGFFNLYFGPATGEDEPAPAPPKSDIRVQPGDWDEELGGYVFKLSSLKKGATVSVSGPLISGDCGRSLSIDAARSLLPHSYMPESELLIEEEDDGRYYCLGLLKDGGLVETRPIFIDWRLLSGRLQENNLDASYRRVL